MKKDKVPTPFSSALSYLLSKKGHGSSVECARSVGVAEGYVSELKKPKKDGSEKVRRKIASYLGYSYADMLSLGQWILAKKVPSEWSRESRSLEEMDSLIDTLQKEYDALPPSEKLPEEWEGKPLSSLSKEDKEKALQLMDNPHARIGVQLLTAIIEKEILELGEEWRAALKDNSLTYGDLIKIRDNAKEKSKNIHASIDASFPAPSFEAVGRTESPRSAAYQEALRNLRKAEADLLGETPPDKPSSSPQPKKHGIVCKLPHATNKHQAQLEGWINRQDEPEIYWGELKRHLNGLEPEFREYCKKNGDNVSDRQPEDVSVNDKK